MTTPKLSDRELDAQIAVIDGWRWEAFKSGDLGPLAVLVPPEDSDFEPVNYPRGRTTVVDATHERFSDWDRCVINRKTNEFAVPRYSSSLDALAPVVKKTIEEKGARTYIGHLEAVMETRNQMVEPEQATILTASPRQIAEAVVRCWE